MTARLAADVRDCCAGQPLHLLNEPSSVLDLKHNGQMAETSRDHALRASGMLLVGFVLVCCWVTLEGYLPGDEQALAEIHEAVGARLDAPMSIVAEISNLEPVAVAAAGVVAILAWGRRWVEATRFVVAVVVVWVANPVLKELVARDRPTVRPDTREVSEYSFPSGHAADTAALGVALVMVTWDTSWRIPMVVACAFFVALVGVSQLILGVHYPSDVLAGWLWAAGWAIFASSRSLGDRAATPSSNTQGEA
jgi:PAP2 superfamily